MKALGVCAMLTLLLASCARAPVPTPVPAASSETQLPARTPELTATPPEQPIPISAPPIAFLIPRGLGTGADARQVEAVPPSETNAGDPAHLKVSLQGGGAEIYVYPMAEYAAVDGAADYSIRLLKDILARGTPPSTPDDSPRVPFAHAGLPLAAKAEILPFRGGSGLRMVVQYASDVSPINNMGLLYQFMGLSRDGRYFVIVMCPLDLPFLAADGDPSGPVPPGGIPFPQQMSASAYEDYFRQVTELTERAPAALFDPSLDALDALVQSISTIAAPPYTPAGTPAP